MIYLVMYEIRTIQKYIYHSSKLKEIESSSAFVSNILRRILKKTCGHFKLTEDINDEKELEENFKFDNQFDLQVAYEGGGNLTCFLKAESEDKVHQFNQYVGYLFLKETYSLRVCYAFVEKTDDFSNDRKTLTEKIGNLKSLMPETCLQPGFPITMTSTESSYPLSEKGVFASDTGNKIRKITKESKCKLDVYEKQSEYNNLDEMRDKGNDSFLAIVHIDANDLGIAINNFFDGKKAVSYEEAVNNSRHVSNAIYRKYNLAFESYIEDYVTANTTEKEQKAGVYRIIVNSGDDITFIIRNLYAIDVVTGFLKKINNDSFFDNDNKISACAGIVFIKAHFPYDKGYEMAEELCELSKEKAKKTKPSLCAFDYYICQNGMISTVSDDEKKHKCLYSKPYYVNRHKNCADDFETLKKNIDLLLSNKLTLGKVKQIRNSYEKGKGDIEMTMKQLSSRLDEPLLPFDENEKAIYYDASTLIDFTKFADNKAGE